LACALFCVRKDSVLPNAHIRLHFLAALILATILAPPSPAQTTPKQLDFEVASIKPANPDGPESLSTDRAAGLHATNFPLRAIITFAWNIRDFQLAAVPGWVDAERYDIIAKIERDGTLVPSPDNPRAMTDDLRTTLDDRFRERIRSLLASRFNLTAHHETRDQQVYALVLSKNGPKLKVAVQGDQFGFRGGRGGRNQGFAVTTDMLANELARIIGRPVLNRTGLTEKYDYVLEWTPDTPQSSDRSGPTIFAALHEQLGLQLESVRAAVDTLVIDHVERPFPN